MKILFIIQNIVVGGVENQLFRTVEFLSINKEIEITIATNKIEHNDFLLSFISNNQNIKLIQIPLIDIPQKKLITFFSRRYKKFIRKIKLNKFYRIAYNTYDVIIDYKNANFFSHLKKYKKYKKAKVITMMHGSYSFLNSFFGESRFKDILNFYDGIICLTYKFKKQLIENYPMFKDKTFIIYNSIDFNQIKNNLIKNEMNFNLPETFISCISRLDSDKDQVTLINAFYRIEKIFPELKLVLVGDGETRQNLELLVDKLNLKSKIIFLGSLLNPLPIMKKSLFTILSSKSEGLPLVLLEALCLEVPIISADCPDGPGEVLKEGEFGLLFNPGDVEDLKLKMIKALENPQIMKEKARLGFQSLYRFDINQNTEYLYKLLFDLINK